MFESLAYLILLAVAVAASYNKGRIAGINAVAKEALNIAMDSLECENLIERYIGEDGVERVRPGKGKQ